MGHRKTVEEMYRMDVNHEIRTFDSLESRPPRLSTLSG
jgi:hypothetical protein